MRLLKNAINALKARRAQITAEDTKLENALIALGWQSEAGRKTVKRTMTKAQRTAVSKRMKAYWRKRRATSKE